MRILLAEHHRRLLNALRNLIIEKTEHMIIGEAHDWEELLVQMKESQPDLVLLDWELPGRPGADMRADLCSLEHRPKVIILSTWSEVKERALAAGADAFVSKDESPDKLLEVL